VVVRTIDGDPVVLRNEPLLDDGTPMPTRYWLCGERETVLAGRLESEGAVNAVEAELDPALIAAAHERYARERDAQIPADHVGPRPSGGVGGTRVGVKCIHAHLGWWLAGGDDPVGSWAAQRLGLDRANYIVTSAPVRGEKLAAIDIGTNSTNLLLVDEVGQEVERRVTVTRLGRNLAATRELSEESMTATLETLAGYMTLIRQSGSQRILVTATEACRRARNAEQFITRARDILGVTPEIVTGEREAHLSFLGATAHLDPIDGDTLVIDIGGGSTEMIVGNASGVRFSVSYPIGAVTLTESHFTSDPPRPEDLTNAMVRRPTTSTTSSATILRFSTSPASSGWPARSSRSPPSRSDSRVSTQVRSMAFPSPVRQRRTCSAPSPPSASRIGSPTRVSHQSAPTLSSEGAACSSRSCGDSNWMN
ncbi:MAG: DUF501 domain-containing protein, partial [Actinobacteria bacterium]|nr:DUF501 domain-containing protein [Actinomycetota bacterium]